MHFVGMNWKKVVTGNNWVFFSQIMLKIDIFLTEANKVSGYMKVTG